MIADKIMDYLNGEPRVVSEQAEQNVAAQAANAFRRQFMERSERAHLGLSACGNCPRQSAYKHHAFPVNGKRVDARALCTFHLGDLAEIAVVNLAVLAGARLIKTGLDQETVTLNVGGVDFVGHPDGIHLGEDGKARLLEVKSMSSYGFQEFERGQISYTYRCQQNAYCECLGLDESVMVAVAKDSGVVKELVVKREATVVSDLTNRLLQVAQSTPALLPAREYGPDDKGFLPTYPGCGYCPYYGSCWPGVEEVVVKGRTRLKVSKGE